MKLIDSQQAATLKTLITLTYAARQVRWVAWRIALGAAKVLAGTDRAVAVSGPGGVYMGRRLPQKILFFQFLTAVKRAEMWTELRDYCSDIMGDGGDEDWSESASGY